jgi:hypothetical protein
MKKIQTEIYCRVSGYFRPVDSFNKGKQQEFWERTKFLQDAKNNKLQQLFDSISRK